MGNPKEGRISSATARMRDHGIIRAEESKSFPGMADYSVHQEPTPKQIEPAKAYVVKTLPKHEPATSLFDFWTPQLPLASGE